jgi:aspartate/methionine/tyrosine aminotransferase
MARRVAGFGTTVFVEINDLARQCNAVNLGQGAPDFDGPSEVLAAAVKAINGELNQYAASVCRRCAKRSHATPTVFTAKRSIQKRMF